MIEPDEIINSEDREVVEEVHVDENLVVKIQENKDATSKDANAEKSSQDNRNSDQNSEYGGDDDSDYLDEEESPKEVLNSEEVAKSLTTCKACQNKFIGVYCLPYI